MVNKNNYILTHKKSMFLFHRFFLFYTKRSVPKNYLPSYNIIVYLKKNTKIIMGNGLRPAGSKEKKRKRHRR
jgi:hypothetical protein